MPVAAEQRSKAKRPNSKFVAIVSLEHDRIQQGFAIFLVHVLLPLLNENRGSFATDSVVELQIALNFGSAFVFPSFALSFGLFISKALCFGVLGVEFGLCFSVESVALCSLVLALASVSR